MVPSSYKKRIVAERQRDWTMKNTVVTFKQAKEKGEKLTMLTAYDYSTAKLIDEAGINAILVGDSLGMVVLGYEDTLSVTMEDMIHHSAAVSRGIKDTLLITDMPFMSYQTSVYDAVVNAGRLVKEGHAQAVKLEGGKEVCPQIKAIVDASIPVCAHLGLTPQSVNAFGGFKVQGKGEEAAQKLLDEARACGRGGRSICSGARVRAKGTCKKNYREHKHTYNRYRSGSRLRRPGACISGYACHVCKHEAEICKAVCTGRKRNE